MKKLHAALISFFAMLLLLGVDQWSKAAATAQLKEQPNIILLPGVFELSYLENFGAAFGMLQNMRSLFVVITFAVLAFLAFALYRMPVTRHFLPLRITGIILGAGAVGNMIDRIWHGYVVDFFYFSLIDFPVFNVADCYVVVAAFLAFALLCFYYKDEDFSFFKKKSDSKSG